MGRTNFGQSTSVFPVLVTPAGAPHLTVCVVMQISKQYTQYGAALLFFIFGFKMLYEVATAVEQVPASSAS